MVNSTEGEYDQRAPVIRGEQPDQSELTGTIGYGWAATISAMNFQNAGNRWKPLENAGNRWKVPESSGKFRKTL
jgi:hypothetical protein